MNIPKDRPELSLTDMLRGLICLARQMILHESLADQRHQSRMEEIRERYSVSDTGEKTLSRHQSRMEEIRERYSVSDTGEKTLSH